MSTGINMTSVNKIKELAEAKEYGAALDIVDTQDLDKSYNPQFLRLCGEIYIENGRYGDARKVLLKAHKMAPEGNRILYELIRLYLHMGYFSLADIYYEQYLFNAGEDDTGKIFLKYMIRKAAKATERELMSILLPVSVKETTDKWTFELALLFCKVGRRDKANEECDYLISTYKGSPYVQLAKDLKAGKIDVNACFYRYPLLEQEEDYQQFGELIKEEQEQLKKDDLRMHPVDPVIMIMEDDNEELTQFSLKGAMDFLSKKRKSKVKEKDKKAGENQPEKESAADETENAAQSETSDNEIKQNVVLDQTESLEKTKESPSDAVDDRSPETDESNYNAEVSEDTDTDEISSKDKLIQMMNQFKNEQENETLQAAEEPEKEKTESKNEYLDVDKLIEELTRKHQAFVEANQPEESVTDAYEETTPVEDAKEIAFEDNFFRNNEPQVELTYNEPDEVIDIDNQEDITGEETAYQWQPEAYTMPVEEPVIKEPDMQESTFEGQDFKAFIQQEEAELAAKLLREEELLKEAEALLKAVQSGAGIFPDIEMSVKESYHVETPIEKTDRSQELLYENAKVKKVENQKKYREITKNSLRLDEEKKNILKQLKEEKNY